MYNYNARWYDPNLGRFITEDPVRDGNNYYIYVSNNPLKFIDPSGLEGKLYLYSHDVTGPGTNWEYTFYESAFAESLKNEDSKKDVPIEFVGVKNRTEFKEAIEAFFNKNGTIDELKILSHMYSEGLNLDNNSDERERLVKSSDLEDIEADISDIKLCACNAGVDLEDGNNIAESFAEKFDAEVTAATSGTWFVGDTNSIGPFDRPGLTLEPRTGEWKAFEPPAKEIVDEDN